MRELTSHVERMTEALRGAGHTVEALPVTADPGRILSTFEPDGRVVFNWCEAAGTAPGAADRVAAALDRAGFAYTGSSPAVLRRTQDKIATKHMLERYDIPTPQWRRIRSPADLRGWQPFPAIVKPMAEHSSFGITPESVVLCSRALAERVDFVRSTYAGDALVEEFIEGREFSISIWGNAPPRPLPLYELDMSSIENPLARIVDFDAKWKEGSLRFKAVLSRCPVSVSPAADRALMNAALRAYRLLGLRDYGRVDLRLSVRGPFVVDVNANPDLTTTGGFVRTAAAAGYDYGAAMSCIVRHARERAASAVPCSSGARTRKLLFRSTRP